MLLALAGLDATRLGSKRAVVYSHDKKKDSYTEGYLEGNTCCFDDFKYVCIGKSGILIGDVLAVLSWK